jgi:putative transcriptional regulator
MQVFFMNEYGKINIKLEELIKKAGISKNKLSHKAEMQRTQINNYCKNQITRLDTDVLARICSVLDCKIEDLLEFVPSKPDKN